MSGLFCFWHFAIDRQTATQRKEIMATSREGITGLSGYRKALAAVITAFTGVSDLYELPAKPEIEMHTDHASVEQRADLALALLAERGYDA
jgi:adenylylsulfate kinase-like enzyme